MINQPFSLKIWKQFFYKRNFQQGGIKKYKVPKHTRQEGLEAIIHCNNRFDRAAEKLSWDS